MKGLCVVCQGPIPAYRIRTSRTCSIACTMRREVRQVVGGGQGGPALVRQPKRRQPRKSEWLSVEIEPGVYIERELGADELPIASEELAGEGPAEPAGELSSFPPSDEAAKEEAAPPDPPEETPAAEPALEEQLVLEEEPSPDPESAADEEPPPEGPAACRWCRGEISTAANELARYCSRACRSSAKKARRRERDAELAAGGSPAPRPPCIECGAVVPPTRFHTARTCSDDCSDARRRKGKSAGHRRRRAAAGAGEPPPAPREPGPPPKSGRALDLRVVVPGAAYPVAARTGSQDREFDCTRYDDCLDVAVRMDWLGWSCAECPIRGTCSVAPDIAAATYRDTTLGQAAAVHVRHLPKPRQREVRQRAAAAEVDP